MNMFKRKGVDVFDYTLLQKKGLLKTRSNSEGNPADSILTEQAGQQQSAGNPFSFLDNMAQASSASAISSINQSNAESTHDVNTLKLKIEDVEYKLERLIDRLTNMEYKLEQFERKG